MIDTCINVKELQNANPAIYKILQESRDVEEARNQLYDYFSECELHLFDTYFDIHPIEKKKARECINIFKNIIAKQNEKKTGSSCLNALWNLVQAPETIRVSEGFLWEMKHLLLGIKGRSDMYFTPKLADYDLIEIANFGKRKYLTTRAQLLDEKSHQYKAYVKKHNYKSGLDPDVHKKREANKKRIMELCRASERDWQDYRWHLRHPFRTLSEISRAIELTAEEKDCIRETEQKKYPFYITPFYLSLLDEKSEASQYDRSLRAQVIPNRIYLDKMQEYRHEQKEALDFMKEMENSPVDLVTRRYPMISIFKPFPSCPQICVYCQRNWEIQDKNTKDISHTSDKLDQAISWFKNNPHIDEVLITGGDPLTLSNERLEQILKAFQTISHIKRIRIGSRILVTIPMRFDAGLLEILARYHRPPEQSITLITHIQQAYEISFEMKEKVQQLKKIGLDILNQQVFTIQNCRRFETCFLRENLKSIGITPYYLFNLKDKEETSFFKVPIARILQERKEEARLLPGLMRTDKAVFNIPTSGKNDLCSCDDHELIMIKDDGSRIYEFYPWEKELSFAQTFIYKDEPIYNFLKEMAKLGEKYEDYKSIWYYY